MSSSTNTEQVSGTITVDSKDPDVTSSSRKDHYTNKTLSDRLNADLNLNNDDNSAEETEEENAASIKNEDIVFGADKLFKDLKEKEQSLAAAEIDLSNSEIQARFAQASELRQSGNALFKEKEYDEAVLIYTKALEICPVAKVTERSILFSNHSACYTRQESYISAIADCSMAIHLNSSYAKPLLRRADLYEKVENLDAALKDYEALLKLEPTNLVAREACMRLPNQINERNERMKTEMFSKLKDLGNMCLRPFGLSTDNFQVNQDPTSGGYSINFVQSPTGNGK